MVAIAILAAILFISDIKDLIVDGKSNLAISTAILTISTWSCLPLAIIVLVIGVLAWVVGVSLKNKE